MARSKNLKTINYSLINGKHKDYPEDIEDDEGEGLAFHLLVPLPLEITVLLSNHGWRKMRDREKTL